MCDYTYESDDERPLTGQDIRRRAVFFTEKLTNDGVILSPVHSAKKSIATTFWGQAWNRNISKYSLFANQLGPGRSCLRFGAVIDFKVSKGIVQALVAGSTLYDVEIKVHPVSTIRWNRLVEACTGDISTVADLLAGKLSDEVIARLVDEDRGLFPEIDEITFSCTCPDWTDVCQHVAAVLYGFSVRLDKSPELFFELRGVEPADFISSSSQAVMAQTATHSDAMDTNEIEDLESMFGIDIKR